MADVGMVVDRGTADVYAHMAIVDGFKALLAASQVIVYG
jgi:cold shock CspA family protein